ncbi:MAG: hypothetical protein LBU87_03870 [Lactobacillales bacterium]|jgi:hypothetical protein|nr:hypothetical protein [Lactobacillales bacterium]
MKKLSLFILLSTTLFPLSLHATIVMDPPQIAKKIVQYQQDAEQALGLEHIKNVTKQIEETKTSLLEPITGAMDSVSSQRDALLNSVGGNISTITGGINSSIGGVTGGIGDAVGGVTGGINSGIQSGVDSTLGSATSAAGDSKNSALSEFSSTVSGMGGNLGDLFAGDGAAGTVAVANLEFQQVIPEKKDGDGGEIEATEDTIALLTSTRPHDVLGPVTTKDISTELSEENPNIKKVITLAEDTFLVKTTSPEIYARQKSNLNAQMMKTVSRAKVHSGMALDLTKNASKETQSDKKLIESQKSFIDMLRGMVVLTVHSGQKVNEIAALYAMISEIDSLLSLEGAAKND